VRIIDADGDRRSLDSFLELPRQIYAGDPYHRATPRASVLEDLGRERFRGRQRLLLAVEGDRCVARAVARISSGLKYRAGRPCGMIGFFEAFERPPAVNALFGEAIRWLRREGAEAVVGPMDGDTWHAYRLNLGPFQRPPFPMEPYNKSYYADLWLGFGFRELARYQTKRIENVAEIQPRLEPILDRALSRGYRFRSLDPKNMRDELHILYRLATAAFAKNLLYSEISRKEFLALYEPVLPRLETDLVMLARAPDGTYTGFLLGVLHRGQQSLSPLLRDDVVHLKSFGVVPSRRAHGVGSALVCKVYQRMVEKGLHTANMCLMRDGSASNRYDFGRATIVRRYALYEYPFHDTGAADPAPGARQVKSNHRFRGDNK
jgi:GNAT superfamily N-acetyltransferase